MDPLTQHQLASNAESRDQWACFANHRRQVTALVDSAAPSASSRLCVLGAGNANDLDLAALLSRYREICLVDLDPSALEQGAARQGVAAQAGLRLVGGLDVTGLFPRLAAWTPATVLDDADLAELAAAPLRDVLPRLPGPFDVVVSACLLTQLLAGVVRALGVAHPRFVPALQALRAGHLRLLANLLSPGGVGLVITDVLSSDTLPALPTTDPAVLPALLADALQRGNFFHGVHPAALRAALQSDPLVGDVAFVPPWLWDLGPRVYLVYACRFRRCAVATVNGGGSGL